MSKTQGSSEDQIKGSPKPVRLTSPTQRILAGAAILLPTLTLVPLGGLYLWEYGLVLWWALGALVLATSMSLGLRWTLRRTPITTKVLPDGALAKGDEHWTKAEEEAWQDVLAIAARVDVDRLTDQNYILQLGQQTLDCVAKRLHGEKTDALWRFTAPEALAIIERVSRRLGRFVATSIPFGDQLTVAQVRAVYRWRGAVDVAERAFDLWRILRIVNPATAVTNEARERLSRAVYNYGKEQVSRRIAEAFVEEVGRAAIDLYGGRLKVAERLSTSDAKASASMLDHLKDQSVTLRVVVGGRSRADRLAVATLLADALNRVGISQATAPETALTVFAPPVAMREQSTDISSALKELDGVDIVVWLASNDAFEADFMLLRAYREALGTKSRDELPPLLIPVFIGGEADMESASTRSRIVRALSEAMGGMTMPEVHIKQIDIATPDTLAAVASALADHLEHARRVNMVRRIRSPRHHGVGATRQGRPFAQRDLSSGAPSHGNRADGFGAHGSGAHGSGSDGSGKGFP